MHRNCQPDDEYVDWESSNSLLISPVLLTLMIPLCFLSAIYFLQLYLNGSIKDTEYDKAAILIMIGVLWLGGFGILLFFPRIFVYAWSLKRMTYKDFPVEDREMFNRIKHALGRNGVAAVEFTSSKRSIRGFLERKEFFEKKLHVASSSISISISKGGPSSIYSYVRVLCYPCA